MTQDHNTDYNDGNWHGWNGGECPVHPESEIEAVYLMNDKADSAMIFRNKASEKVWCYAFLFRVVKPYTEPREGYAVTLFRSAREAKTAHPGCDPIFVREVKE